MSGSGGLWGMSKSVGERGGRGLLLGALAIAVAVAAWPDSPSPPGATASTTTVEDASEDAGEAEAISPEPAPVDAAGAFAIEDVLAQAEVTPGTFMVLGTAPRPRDGRPILTLGGAVRAGEAWAVALHARFGPCEDVARTASRAERLVPGSAALVVRCPEGDDRTTIYVFGAAPGTNPGVLLQVSCGHTDYDLRGTTIAVTSVDEQGRRRDDLEYSLDGPILETAGRLPPYCDRLDD